MDAGLGKTKTALILAAGELFADRGLDGASIRSIAQKAGTNIAAINYHFGSKENLYRETLRYILKSQHPSWADVVTEDDPRLSTPEGQSALLYDAIRRVCTSHLNPDVPAWHWRLLIRSFLLPSGILGSLVEELMRPDHERFKALIRRIRPDMTEQELVLWDFSLMGEVVIYILGREPMCLLLGVKTLSPEFLESAADHVARVVLAGLGLPVPTATRGGRV